MIAACNRRPLLRGTAASLLLAAALVVSPPAAQDVGAADVASLLEKADRRFDRGDFRRAARMYAKADRAAEGRSVPALVGLARSSVKIGDYDETIAVARRWRELDGSPQSRAASLYFEGMGHFWQGMTARWKAMERQAAGSSPTGRSALESAVHAFRAGLAASPSSPARASTCLFLADALVELGELRAAEEALAGYAQSGGDDPYADNLRCWIAQFEDAAIVDASAPGVTPPEKIYTPYPQYTREAREARAQGSMLLHMAVTAQGDVQCLRVIRGLPFGMVQATTQAVREWRFRPALFDGQPVPVHYYLTIDFTLK